jgi:hypothetical protein
MAILLQDTYNRDAFMKQLWKRQQRQSDDVTAHRQLD